MADGSMLSLFDTDGGFLDELATDNIGGSAPMMDGGGLIGGQTNMQMNPVMNSQQPQMYNQQMGGMPPTQYNNIPMSHSTMPPQNQFMGNNFGQNQFNTNKLHHFGGPMQQPQQSPVSGTHVMVQVMHPNQQQ